MRSVRVTPEQVYTSIGSNRNENNISCRAELLLFSKCKSPILYDTSSRRVFARLLGHQDETNGQRFVDHELEADGQPGLHVISTSHDKTAIIWDIDQSGQAKALHTLRLAPERSSLFTTRCSLRRQDGHFVSVTTTLDDTICVWRNDHLVQQLDTSYYCFDSKLLTIQVNNVLKLNLLALAGSDNKVHIFHLTSDNQLAHLLDLTGYDDWVKCLDSLTLETRDSELLLATASQDCLVRVWHIKIVSSESHAKQMRTISSGAFAGGNYWLLATLETVLSRHDGFVHGLCWFKRPARASDDKPRLRLVSCSGDKTVIVWQSSVASAEELAQKKYNESPASDGIWREVSREGETGETNLPFIGICLSPDETTLYAQSLKGAIHCWRLKEEGPDNEGDSSRPVWEPLESITGHFDVVSDLSWEKAGRYLLSASWDKTCRMHAIAAVDDQWHELSRPQVHGHELNCVASLSPFRFASGAEEKTIRAFGATEFFIKNFESLAKSKLPDDCSQPADRPPVHAQLPALGLSNRGAQHPYDMGADQAEAGDKKQLAANNDWYDISLLVKRLAKLDCLRSIPHEEILLQSTLWWETSKLFGHCNEIHALASDSTGTFLASASKANRPDLASILVWETAKFRRVATIEHHSLTVTRLRFSPDDRHLLSVSRDRTWSLSVRTGQLRNAYEKVFASSKRHERIIWDCCWTWDSRFFVTVSRDKQAIMWSVDELSDDSEVASRTFASSIQAVDSPGHAMRANGRAEYTFLFGLEDGALELCALAASGQWSCLATFERHHESAVRRLAVQPRGVSESDADERAASNSLLLASCGDDHVVRLDRFTLEASG